MKLNISILNNKWKSILASIALAITLGFSSSCSDLLDEKLYGQSETEEHFTTVSKLESAVKGIYKPLINKQTYGQMWMVAESGVDNYRINGSLGHVARDVGNYNTNSENAWVEKAWALYFDGINRANTVITYGKNIEPKNEGDEDKKKQLLAEAHFMRGLLYFDLVKWWGGVPLMLEPSKIEHNFDRNRDSRNAVYDQIVKDMELSIPDLKWATTSGQGRANKGAAMGILARVYLFKGGYYLDMDGQIKRNNDYKKDYERAVALLDELITSENHGLEKSYEALFKDYYCSTGDYKPYESLFELDFLAIPGESDNLFGVWGTYNSPETAADVPQGRANAFMKTFGHFYDSFDTKDLRRDISIDPNKYTWDKATNSLVVTKQNRKKSYLWAPGKWRRVWHTMQKVDNNNTDINYIMLRYSDVLLMYAEAENELSGPTALAVERFNQVRRRGFGKPIETPDASVDKKFSSSVEFFNAIVDERSWELCFEGHRRQDLIRWNLLETKVKETAKTIADEIATGKLENKANFYAGDKFESGKSELLPIPARDIRETNGSLEQNPGYGI